MERVITRRLTWFLETNNIFSPSQTGYCQHCSAEDQLTLFSQDIENPFQEKRKLLAVFFNLSKEFKRVWKKRTAVETVESRTLRPNVQMDQQPSLPQNGQSEAWWIAQQRDQAKRGSPARKRPLTDSVPSVCKWHCQHPPTKSHKFTTCWRPGCMDLCWTHLHSYTCHARDHQQSKLLDRWVVHGNQLQQNTSNTLLTLHCERESGAEAGRHASATGRQSNLPGSHSGHTSNTSGDNCGKIREKARSPKETGGHNLGSWHKHPSKDLHRSSPSHCGVCHNLLGHRFKSQQEQAWQCLKCCTKSHSWCHEEYAHQGDGEESRPGASGTPKNI